MLFPARDVLCGSVAQARAAEVARDQFFGHALSYMQVCVEGIAVADRAAAAQSKGVVACIFVPSSGSPPQTFPTSEFVRVVHVSQLLLPVPAAARAGPEYFR